MKEARVLAVPRNQRPILQGICHLFIIWKQIFYLLIFLDKAFPQLPPIYSWSNSTQTKKLFDSQRCLTNVELTTKRNCNFLIKKKNSLDYKSKKLNKSHYINQSINTANTLKNNTGNLNFNFESK